MKSIKLSRGLFAVVDDADYEALSKFTWSSQVLRGYVYAHRRVIVKGKTKMIRMHRQIMGVTKPSVLVDHIDGNTLNNTRANLRITDKSGNARNKKPTGSSQYMGVSRHRGKKWLAHIKIGKKYKHLGVFDSELDAAKAYNKAVFEAGLQDFARINKV